MKYILIILFVLTGFISNAQLPVQTVPNQYSTGYFRWGWPRADSGIINAVRDTFYARYDGTQIIRVQGGDTAQWFNLGRRWFRGLKASDTVPLHNQIITKLNINDTTLKWWGIGKRWQDTMYRINDSTIGFTINGGAQQTIQILGRVSGGGGGGSGTVTSVGLSMPSAFSVSGSPITSSGTLNVSGAGLSTEYIKGNGTLGTTDTSMIPNFYLKVRGLFSGTSPISYNSTTGAIGIANANTTGTKGAASFSSADFIDNGSGLISLAAIGSAGNCINCQLTIDTKGRVSSYANGSPPQVYNFSGAGDTLSINDSIKRLNPGYGILHAVTANNITQSVDTSSSNGLVTKYALSQIQTFVPHNIGAGLRWLATPSGNFKTVVSSNTILWDSSSNSNALTAKADTSVLATQYDLTQITSGINQLTGDVTAGPGSGSQVATIANNAVTYAKFQQNPASSLIGNPTGSTANNRAVFPKYGLTFNNDSLKTDTTTLKRVYLKRSGVNPGGYASANILADTLGNIIYADAARNDLVSFNGVSDTVAFGRPAAHFNSNLHQGLTTVSNPSLQGGATSLTFAAWVKLDSLGLFPQTILSKDDNRTKKGSEYLMSYYPPYSGWVWQVEEPGHVLPNDGTTWYVISSTGVPVANQWYFIVGQYDIAGKVKIWVNGVVDSAAAVVGGTNVTNTPFCIGGVVDDYDTTGLPECCSFMNGTIKSVGMWKRLLTTSEITYLYNNTSFQTPAPGLNPGTMINGPTFASSVPTPLSSYIYSVNYDGTNDKTAMQNGITMAAGTSSVSLWFNSDNLGGMVLGNSLNANAYVRVLNANTIRVQTNVTSTFQDFTVSTISNGTWYNLIVTRATSNLTHVYLDGVESSSGGLSQTDPIGLDEVGLYWDGSVPGLNFDGKISDVRIYNSALSGGDIGALQTNSATTATPFLWYKLNEGSGVTNIDYGTAPIPHPFEYSELTSAYQFEQPNTFISYWDLSEPYGTRLDGRNRNVFRDSATTNLLVDIKRQNQYLYGSTQSTGSLYLKSTSNTSPTTGSTIKMIVNSNNYRAFTAFNSGKVSVGDSIENDNLSILAPTLSNTVSIGLRRNDGLLLAGLGTDGSANTLLQANSAFEIRSGTNNPLNLNPSNEGVTVGSVRSTDFRFDVLEDRTGRTDTTVAIYAALSGAMLNTTSAALPAVAIWGLADAQRSSGSNPVKNIALYGRALNGQENYSLWLDSGYFKFRNVAIPPSTYNILVHGLTDSNVYQIPVSSLSLATLYSGDGSLAGNRVVTGSSHNLTFNSIFNYRINANSFVLDQNTTGAPYSFAVIGTDKYLDIAYTPTPATYDKGAGIIIDTNNNAGLGGSLPTTAPLYTSGNSAFVNGFQSSRANFYRVDSIATNTTINNQEYFFVINAAGGNITMTLPKASTVFGSGMGVTYVFKRIDNSGNTVTVQINGSSVDLIDGASSFTIVGQYTSKGVQCASASNWYISNL